ncbi:UPF0235 protein C15orf40 homolog [Uloborus diversus]|uniref:UPF0235 protein C15orf40 homolog n=1 Tax=Uloborus diversus TaxID=327109 RepID=UPI002408FDFF|nr:UPF0235 protein C15orf40 homolog [Uloborus diversus]
MQFFQLQRCVIRKIGLNQSYFHLSSLNMPKKKTPSGPKKGVQETAPASGSGAVYSSNKNEIIIKVHAKPGSKISAITSVDCDAVGVQIGAPAVDGEANKELVRYLGEVLNLKKSQLCLAKFSKSREKTVVITDSDMPSSSVLDILTKACEKQ